jgi:cobalt/nickel transport system permease protein
MTLGIDIPTCPPSPVQRWDPRWKLAAMLLAALCVVQVRTPGPALTALAGTLFLAALARVPWRWFGRRLGTALGMFVLFLVWLPFVVQPGDATFDVGVVTISLPGLARLVVLSANIAGMITLVLVLLATTPVHVLFKAARALWLPRVLVLLLLLTYRYVFLLMDEFARLRVALRVRGFRNRADMHSYRTVGQVAGTLLVRSHERSERVGQAMQCRGFDGECRTLDDFRAGRADVLAFAGIVGYAALVLAWDWLGR